MSAAILIKRSQVTATPASLLEGELAYSELSDTLFIGEAAGVITAIGGPGIFAKLGSPTFTGTPLAPTASSGTNSTQIATTAFVKAQSYLVGPTITASVVSDFDAQVRASRLDQMAAPTASVSLGSQKITGLASPSVSTDAANKAYVDGVASGLDIKASVRCATTGNITLSGTQTIDGVAAIAGDRVLAKNQTAGSQNGIYVVSAGAWARATDFLDSTTVTPGAFAFIEEGTVNGGHGWVLTNTGAITVGSTSLAFAQFSGGGTYTNGNGLSLTGSAFAVVGTANRITVGASVDIDAAYVGQTSITTLGTVTTGTIDGGTF